MRRLSVYLIFFMSIFFFQCQEEDQKSGEEKGLTLYFGGDILTMEGAEAQYAEALVEQAGKIIFVGRKSEAEAKYAGKYASFDLKGKTLLPGFIDPHSHFMLALNMVNQVNVGIPPVGEVEDIASLQKKMLDFQRKKQIPEGAWVVAWGYDNEGLKEKRHLTKLDLDKVLPNHKVMVIHVSNHGAVLNSKALEWASITAETPDPAGGLIARMEGSNEPAGLLMETAYLPIFSQLPRPSNEDLLAMMHPAQQMYARNGYTHAQDGFSFVESLDFLQLAAAQKKIYLDIACLPAFVEIDRWANKKEYPFGEYRNHLKLQGIKIVQDGSPQGKTAYVSNPYKTGGLDGNKDWRGEASMSSEQLNKLVAKARALKLPIFIHANGDAAIDQAIAAVEKEGLKAKDDHRTVIIHSQFQRPDQLDKYQALGISPSYFTNHCFFWGDVHIENIGLEEASFISPLQAAVDKGIVYSNHSDFNVTPLDPFFIIWTAMQRETRSGEVLGRELRVDAYTALQGLTTGPAYQLFEENRKGKIKVGLLADFVILDKNPLKVLKEDIPSIQVVNTIKEGKKIYPQ